MLEVYDWLGSLIAFAMGYGAAWVGYWVWSKRHAAKRGR